MTTPPDDDEDEEALLQDFFAEHQRKPFNSREVARWYAQRMTHMARQIREQLDAQGFEVLDGKIVPKTPR